MKAIECAAALEKEIEKIYVGKKTQIRLIITALFTSGHVLLDDLPGSGKTTLIKTISKALGCKMSRIQFTPDLLPSDIIGTTIFDRNNSSFVQVKGPVFTNILLADEINRAIPRTQSALLEAMEEKQVTIDSESHSLPVPFIVMATENPVERESTFALPAAQLDRFFIRLCLGFPEKSEEIQILKESGTGIDFSAVNQVTSVEDLIQLQEEINAVFTSDDILTYIVDLVQNTRNHPDIKFGASPRAAKCLLQGSKSFAAIAGRNYVTPEDVKQLFLPVLSHRIVISNNARYSNKKGDEILESILNETQVPPYKEDLFNNTGL